MSGAAAETKAKAARPGGAGAEPASDERPAGPSSRSTLLPRAGRLVGSYGAAMALLVGLMVIVFYGTFAQRWMSLYDVQHEYFESWVTVLDVGSVPVPFLGGMALLTLLALNLVVGGVIRIRKKGATVGVLIAHAGILLLFVSAAVEWGWSDKGQLTVFEGDGKGWFQSTDDWEIVVRERAGTSERPLAATEWVLPAKTVSHLDEDDVARFRHASLPFELAVSLWQRNAAIVRAEPGLRVVAEAEGFALAPLSASSERSATPGCVATLIPKSGGGALRSLLGVDPDGMGTPWLVTVAGRSFEIDLRPQRFDLPFRVELKRFVHEEHPGTRMPKEFSSYVTKLEDGVARDVHITMNAPLRHRGYTLYQSGWGPQNARPGARLFSTFSVVRNPADRMPIYACFVIFIGLIVHFGMKLWKHIERSGAARHALREGAS
jgi:hypothetical protein